MEDNPGKAVARADVTPALLLGGIVVGLGLAAAALAGMGGDAVDLCWLAAPRAAWLGGQAVRALLVLIQRGGVPMVLAACALVLCAKMLAVFWRQRAAMARAAPRRD
jgi:hypothetical protein